MPDADTLVPDPVALPALVSGVNGGEIRTVNPVESPAGGTDPSIAQPRDSDIVRVTLADEHLVQWPLASKDANITSSFGPRASPCSGCSSNHRGLDFSGPVGEPVGSIAAGVVIDVSYIDRSGLGVHVVVEHRIDGKPTTSVYAHLLQGSVTVSVGDRIAAGDRLGSLGNTGASTGPHLHLEVIVNGLHIDPLSFLQRYADGEDVAIVDRPPVDWHENQPPDAEGEGWHRDEDTLDVDPDKLPEVAPAKPQPSAAPAPSPTPTPTPTPTPGQTTPDETTSPSESAIPAESPNPEPVPAPMPSKPTQNESQPPKPAEPGASPTPRPTPKPTHP